MSELKNPEFWVGIGFCIVCVFLFFNLKLYILSKT